MLRPQLTALLPPDYHVSIGNRAANPALANQQPSTSTAGQSPPAVFMDECCKCRRRMWTLNEARTEVVDTRPASIMYCFHVICTDCSKQFFMTSQDQRRLTCPTCGVLTPCDRLVAHIAPTSQHVKLLLPIICQAEGCPDKRQAVMRCHQCAECLCQGCLDAHRRVTSTRSHDLTPVAKPSSVGSRMCRQHPTVVATTVCKCKQFLCNTCIATPGNVHMTHGGYDTVDVVARTCRHKAMTTTQLLHAQLLNMAHCAQSVDKELRTVDAEATGVKRRTAERMIELGRQLTAKGEQMAMAIDRNTVQRKAECNRMRYELDARAAILRRGQYILQQIANERYTTPSEACDLLFRVSNALNALIVVDLRNVAERLARPMPIVGVNDRLLETVEMNVAIAEKIIDAKPGSRMLRVGYEFARPVEIASPVDHRVPVQQLRAMLQSANVTQRHPLPVSVTPRPSMRLMYNARPPPLQRAPTAQLTQIDAPPSVKPNIDQESDIGQRMQESTSNFLPTPPDALSSITENISAFLDEQRYSQAKSQEEERRRLLAERDAELTGQTMLDDGGIVIAESAVVASPDLDMAAPPSVKPARADAEEGEKEDDVATVADHRRRSSEGGVVLNTEAVPRAPPLCTPPSEREPSVDHVVTVMPEAPPEHAPLTKRSSTESTTSVILNRAPKRRGKYLPALGLPPDDEEEDDDEGDTEDREEDATMSDIDPSSAPPNNGRATVTRVVSLQRSASKTCKTMASADERSEDYCAVCHNGCDEKSGDLGCCAQCPKVYHAACHVPTLNKPFTELPDDWMCTMCVSIPPLAELPAEASRIRTNTNGQASYELTANERSCCEQVLLAVFMHADAVGFQHPVNAAEAPDYYEKITNAIDLSEVRRRLRRKSSTRFRNVDSFVSALNRMFKNCSVYNSAASEVAQAGRRLHAGFVEIVRRSMPCMEANVWAYKVLYKEGGSQSQTDEGDNDHSQAKKAKMART